MVQQTIQLLNMYVLHSLSLPLFLNNNSSPLFPVLLSAIPFHLFSLFLITCIFKPFSRFIQQFYSCPSIFQYTFNPLKGVKFLFLSTFPTTFFLIFFDNLLSHQNLAINIIFSFLRIIWYFLLYLDFLIAS